MAAGDATEHPGVPAAWVQTDLQKAGVELGTPRSQADITTQGKVHAGTHSGSVDRGERGQGTAGDSKKTFIDRTEAGLACLGQVAEVGARAESRRSTRHNNRPDRLVAFDPVHRGDDLFDHRHGQRVAFGRVVQGQRGYTCGLGDDYE